MILVYAKHIPVMADAVATERRIKRWSRGKAAPIREDRDAVQWLAKRAGVRDKAERPCVLRGSPSASTSA